MRGRPSSQNVVGHVHEFEQQQKPLKGSEYTVLLNRRVVLSVLISTSGPRDTVRDLRGLIFVSRVDSYLVVGCDPLEL